MSRIPEAVKRRIVEHLACYCTHAETTDLIREEFNLELTPRHVRSYDPHTFQFAGRSEWRDVHAATRKRFLEEISNISIAHRAYRLRQLEQLYLSAKGRGALVIAAGMLEQAAKEVGHVYTNVSKVQGSSIVAHMHSEVERTTEENRNLLADKIVEAIERMPKTKVAEH
jgi:hypothetical protein